MSSRPSVRETIAAARSRMQAEQAKSKAIRGGNDEADAFKSSGVIGGHGRFASGGNSPGSRTFQRSGSSGGGSSSLDVEIMGPTMKSIKSLIANAKGTGIMNLSNRDLTEVPMEIWKMYHVDPDKVVVDFNSSSTAWYNAVDLTRLIAADNKITFIGPQIQDFGALVVLDFHGNDLTTLPEEMAVLGRLATLNLSSNKIETLPDVLFGLTTLVELRLASNKLSGTLDPRLGRLTKLETLDLSGNQLSALPQELDQLVALRRLNVSTNRLQEMPICILAKMRHLIEIEFKDNKLTTMFSGFGELYNTSTPTAIVEGGKKASLVIFPALVRLDARNSGLKAILDIENEGTEDDPQYSLLALPAIKDLLLSFNALKSVGNVLYTTTQLQALDLRANRFVNIPQGTYGLNALRRLDMANNLMDIMPAELGSMMDLTAMVWEGNPIRNVPRATTTTEALLKLLRQRQASDAQAAAEGLSRVETLAIGTSPTKGLSTESMRGVPGSPRGQHRPESLSNVPSTPPARTGTPSVATPPKRSTTGLVQNLTLTKKNLTDISVDDISGLAIDPAIAQLDFNQFTMIPASIHQTFGLTTLTTISIRNNKIKDFPFTLAFPYLLTLDLSNNQIVEMVLPPEGAVAEGGASIAFPSLKELTLTANRLTSLPAGLPSQFPNLKMLNASRNKIQVIDPASFQGGDMAIETIDLSGNEIGTLPPLLGNNKTIKTLMLDGNLFRVPRRQIMEQGTAAVMEYLRGRIPA